MFWKDDFSLLKSLYEKHRFAKFLGLERGEPTKSPKFVLLKVFLAAALFEYILGFV